MRIKKLSTLVANQIAAGEVIERPASVVKELLENAQDAGAKEINIELSYAGLNQIKISDDGHGICQEDLPLAVVAHATSKITSLDDLYSINSMGFRGEALASISAVAKLSITSRPQEQKHAACLEFMDGDLTITPCPRNVGTTIEVLDLFYNAPVRKKFLRGQRTELQYVEDVIKRFALAVPSISLSVKHNGKNILYIPAGICDKTRMLRVKKIFGAKFVDSALVVAAESSGMKLHGWLGDPGYQRSQRDKQWIYLNNRMVRDKLLQHAVMQVYQEHLLPGRYPACLLYLDMPSASVDVNVHPTKHEVRFKKPRDVHDFLIASLAAKVDLPPACEHVIEAKAGNTHRNRNYQANIDSFISPSSENLQVINSEFAILYRQQGTYLLNLGALQNSFYRAVLDDSQYPLASRPVLVPFSYKFAARDYASFLAAQALLLDLGINFDFVGDNKLVVRTLPQCLPLLDIKLFLSKISDAKDLSQLKLKDLILHSQDFNARLIAVSEQRDLLAYLDKHNLFAKFAVHLSTQVCQDIFLNV